MRFRIDESNIFEELGLEKLVELSTEFYRRVHEDPDPDFRSMFPEALDGAVQNQYEFFAQRFGGPPLYSKRKGHPALRQRHVTFAITRGMADKWLGHMRDAMVHVGLAEEMRARLDEFFTHTAGFLINVDEEGNRLY
jgi:truncated hemoglobin YjbI